MTLDNWTKEHLGNEVASLGIKTLAPFFKKYWGECFKKAKIITVAGTNGKGETSHRLFEMSTVKGLKTALWTSPHILTVKERFCFTVKIEDNLLLNVFNSVKTYCEIEKVSLSYYEFLFACFCEAANSRELDLVILEVGMGGRLDAVNLYDVTVAIITSISKDHSEFLGDTLDKILYEKYGVCRKGKILISALEQDDLNVILRNWTQRDSIEWIDFNDTFESMNERRSCDYSFRNYFCAIKAFTFLYGEINYSYKPFLFLGRGNKVKYFENEISFYGSHNIDGIKKMLNRFEMENLRFNKCYISFSKRADTEIEEMIDLIFEFEEHLGHVGFLHFDHYKSNLNIKNILERKNLQKYFEGHLNSLEIAKVPMHTLVMGSLYFVSEFMKKVAS